MAKRKPSIEARTAARWWADRLRRGSKMDHGDQSREGGVAMALGSLLQAGARSKLTPEQIQSFEENLAEIVDEKMRRSTHPPGVIIDVDYHAAKILHDAAAAAGFSAGTGLFPWKTVMYVQRGEVNLRYGYRAPLETLPLLTA